MHEPDTLGAEPLEEELGVTLPKDAFELILFLSKSANSMQLPLSCRRFIRVTIPEDTGQIVLWWWRNYGGRHWILLLLKVVQFHSLMWRNKNLLCQGGQGQEQEQLRYVIGEHCDP
ncbi:uncharacterized protein [Arachis hypogaea]|uniref:uncharacterized protein n=1 Tax=Arachis hypogaea TaxID=3818 RepID=UPI000DECB6D5|nr:uncharacterized protein LOC112722908 isoform X2 [Arachis hypogaea]